MSSNTGELQNKINDLCRALSWLLAADLTDLPEPTQVHYLRALRPAACKLQALQYRFVAAIEGTKSARARGAVSTAAWLRSELRVPGAAGVVKAAVALSALPVTAAAFAEGDLTEAHVATIVKVAEKLPPQVLAGGVEEILVAQARQLAPSKFAPAAVRIRDRWAPPSADGRPPKERPARWLRTERDCDGRVAVRGMFDPDNGRLLLDSLAAAAAPIASDDRRTPDVRRADALMDVCRRSNAVREADRQSGDVGPDPGHDADLDPVARPAASQSSLPANGRQQPRPSAAPAHGEISPMQRSSVGSGGGGDLSPPARTPEDPPLVPGSVQAARRSPRPGSGRTEAGDGSTCSPADGGAEGRHVDIGGVEGSDGRTGDAPPHHQMLRTNKIRKSHHRGRPHRRRRKQHRLPSRR